MSGLGRLAGAISLAVGTVICLGGSLFLGLGALSQKADSPAIALGFFLLVVFLVLPFWATGGYLFAKGQSEAQEVVEVEREKKILNMVQAQGRAAIAGIALEMKLNREQVTDYIYDLVGKGLFTGYIDWTTGTLFAKEAAEMGTNKCPNCGAERELVGKGIVKCQYCGAELFV